MHHIEKIASASGGLLKALDSSTTPSMSLLARNHQGERVAQNCCRCQRTPVSPDGSSVVIASPTVNRLRRTRARSIPTKLSTKASAGCDKTTFGVSYCTIRPFLHDGDAVAQAGGLIEIGVTRTTVLRTRLRIWRNSA